MGVRISPSVGSPAFTVPQSVFGQHAVVDMMPLVGDRIVARSRFDSAAAKAVEPTCCCRPAAEARPTPSRPPAAEFGRHACRFPVISNVFPDTPTKDPFAGVNSEESAETKIRGLLLTGPLRNDELDGGRAWQTDLANITCTGACTTRGSESRYAIERQHRCGS